MNTTATQQASLMRHPIVVVLGHIDHGKTTLLDTIRKTNVAAKESGGITQHLGAYEIDWHGKKITFLDTPGHETFAKMRERGARVADVAILVVAADDGVKPQTVEALGAIKKAEIPFVVAINKMDKGIAEPDRVKSELAEAGVLVEGWGGNTPVVGISAKEGRNVEELLEHIILLAELEELRADPSLPAEGVVIESHLDPRRGPSATLLVHNGSLRKGEFVLIDDAHAPIRILENTSGEAIDTAGPSSPARVTGFNKIPAVGGIFRTYFSRGELDKNLKIQAVLSPKEADKADIGILLKADVAGTFEALSDAVGKVAPEGVSVKFFDGGVGDITEGDVKTISAARRPIILGFRTKMKPNVADVAGRFGVEVHTFDVIYEAVDWAKHELEALKPKEIVRVPVGKLLVLKLFHSGAKGKIVGGRVREGRVPADAFFEIVRQGTVVARGKVLNMERNKNSVKELQEGEEGGLLVEVPKAVEERDILQFFYEREA